MVVTAMHYELCTMNYAPLPHFSPLSHIPTLGIKWECAHFRTSPHPYIRNYLFTYLFTYGSNYILIYILTYILTYGSVEVWKYGLTEVPP